MEVKKSPKADLESKKSVFMQIGLVMVLSLVFIAFEWTNVDSGPNRDMEIDEEEVEEEVVPITRQEEVKPPPPPPPPKASDILNIVEDDVELDEELVIEDTESTQDDEVDFSDVESEEEDEDDGEVFFVVEDMPEFPGGDQALHQYLAEAVKYPTIAQENGIQGRVYVKFVINTDGSVTDVEVARGVDPSLDKEAVRVVREMPKWKPGEQRGEPVRVSYTVPINFKLQ
ncbi:MAG: energy transducer TonB [Marinilabilia sp.]